MAELYTMQEAVVSVGETYFDNQGLLLADVSEQFQQVLQAIEASVELFTDTIGQDFERDSRLGLNQCLEAAKSSYDIDLATIKGNVAQFSGEKMTYLIDMGKAEALEYLGDFRQAVDLVEGHL